MYNLVLSCSNFPVIGPIIDFLANILSILMNWLYLFLNMLNIANVGLIIIIFTIIIKLIMMPLTVRQQKFSKISAVMNPEIQAIQKKYKGKRDNESVARMQSETKAVYEKYGTSPTGGCLQLAIQLPILLSLYQVILNIETYIPEGVSKTFLGMDLGATPWSMLGIAIAIPIISGLAQFASTRLMTATPQMGSDDSNPMASSMKTMTLTMPIISTIFCFTLPAGVGLYWATSSLFQAVSQLIVNAHFNKIDMDELIKRNMEKAKKKRESKGISDKNVSSASKYNTRNIPQSKVNTSNENDDKKNASVNKNANIKPGSLASKANAVRDMNNRNTK